MEQKEEMKGEEWWTRAVSFLVFIGAAQTRCTAHMHAHGHHHSSTSKQQQPACVNACEARRNQPEMNNNDRWW